MRDVTEKYIRLNKDFPNKAGKLKSLLEAQRRLLETLSKSKQSDKVKELMIASAEAYDVSDDLLTYTHNVLQGVAKDCEVLIDGANLRNKLRLVQEENETLWKRLLG
jgi:flagellar biosynthesis/type III secretory pathway chaperone